MSNTVSNIDAGVKPSGERLGRALPACDGTSWEDRLFGPLAGLACAWFQLN